MMEFATVEQLYDLFSLSYGVNTDSRKIKANEIFIALKGGNFNGNLFADKALELGALYAFVDEEEYVTSEQHILVKDGLTALQNLASFHRSTLDIPIIGLTGSNGKTTTKELIASCLSMQYNCYSTKGNFNNHIGVPLSILEIRPDHEIAVIEMGANHLFEIKELCAIAKPDIGLITNIGLAHIEGFGSEENIKKGKGELYNYLRTTKDKTVFINTDDDVLIKMAKGLKHIKYGLTAPISGEIISSKPLLKMKLIDEEQDFVIQSHLVGEYNFYNALAACTVSKYFNVSLLDIAEAIEEYKPTNKRSQIIEKGDSTIILDSYNANPSSMRAALENFAKQESKNKVAILGHMLELGDSSQQEHLKIIQLCKKLQIDAIYVGKEFKVVAKDQKETWFKSANDVKKLFKAKIDEGTLFLLKGSRGIAIEQILD